jgi:hypothetical protein
VPLGLYGPESLQWAGGGNAAGVFVYVYLPGTFTKAAVFLDDEGEFSKANPVLSDQSGQIAFYAEQGPYDLVIGATRFAINISDNIGDPPSALTELADVDITGVVDSQALVWDSVTGRWRNETLPDAVGNARVFTGIGPPGVIAGAIVGDVYVDLTAGAVKLYRMD